MSFFGLSIRNGAAFAALLFSLPASSDGLPKPPQDYFGEFAYCALILSRNRHEESSIEAGPDQCHQLLSPCSTFKIPNSLIGLQTGVVSGPDDLKKWDGVKSSREANNKDHTLQSAISESIPWYFQALARDVGQERMQYWLQKLEYGNQDISAGIERFWLGSSLRINAYQQMKLIKALWHQNLPFDPIYQQQVSDMLVLESPLNGTLHAKTGSCRGGEDQQPPDHGWFIGWVDWHSAHGNAPATTFFVINTTGPKAWGWEARKIALRILQDLHTEASPKTLTE